MKTIGLDAGPLGLIFQRKKSVIAAQQCRDWVSRCEEKGVRFIVPAVADFEVRRELIRLNLTQRLNLLDRFLAAEPDRYLPLTDAALRRGAYLWAQVRQEGKTTADEHELDCDVLIAAQMLELNSPSSDFVVASTNVSHLSRFVPAELWTNITP